MVSISAQTIIFLVGNDVNTQELYRYLKTCRYARSCECYMRFGMLQPLGKVDSEVYRVLSSPNIYLANPLYKRYNEFHLLL